MRRLLGLALGSSLPASPYSCLLVGSSGLTCPQSDCLISLQVSEVPVERPILSRLTVRRQLAVLGRGGVRELRRPFPESFSSSAPSHQVSLVEVCADGKVGAEGT